MANVRTLAPSRRSRRLTALQAAAVVLAIALLVLGAARSRAVEQVGSYQPAEPYFARTWARTDKPVADLQVSRTWMWGPNAFTQEFREPYAEGHDNSRAVQYFDKSRMEITTDGSVDDDSIWFVTNGLLVTELMTGNLQLGDALFEPHTPAEVNVAGDPLGETGPTYAALANLMDDAPHAENAVITATVDRFGNVGADATTSQYGATTGPYVPETGHRVASVFWEFMNAEGLVWENGAYTTAELFENPYYATGFPLTEAYWTTVPVDGIPARVLVQAFQRRVLTWTPSNPEGWRVEAGNVGRHYWEWRYEQIPAEQPTPTPTTPVSTITPTATTPTSVPTTPTSVGTDGDMQIESISSVLPGSSQPQRVTIRNMQLEGIVNMLGWTLSDDDGDVFRFPEVFVKAGFYVEVRFGIGQNNIGDNWAIIYTGTTEPILDAPGEHVYLKNPQGQLRDTYP